LLQLRNLHSQVQNFEGKDRALPVSFSGLEIASHFGAGRQSPEIAICVGSFGCEAAIPHADHPTADHVLRRPSAMQ
jgi:hypothetical protein